MPLSIDLLPTLFVCTNNSRSVIWLIAVYHWEPARTHTHIQIYCSLFALYFTYSWWKIEQRVCIHSHTTSDDTFKHQPLMPSIFTYLNGSNANSFSLSYLCRTHSGIVPYFANLRIHLFRAYRHRTTDQLNAANNTLVFILNEKIYHVTLEW